MSIRYTLFLLLTLLLVGLVAVATVRANRLLATWPADQNPLLHPGENLMRLLLLLLCVALGLLSDRPAAALGWQWGALGQQLAGGTPAGLLMAAFYYSATRAVVARWGERYYSPRVLHIILPRRRADFPAVALAMLPVVAMEELLFRSLLIGGFGLLAPNWVLVLLSAAVFGLMHSPQGAWGVVGVTLGGIVLGMLFLWTGSLVLPLWTHYVVNMAQLLLAYRLGTQTVSAKP